MKVKIYIAAFFYYVISSCAAAQPINRDTLLNDIRTLSSAAFAGRKPGTEGHQKAIDYITARFQALSLKSFHERYIDRFAITDSLKGHNIIGCIPGKRKEAIVISGHYDHLGERDGQIYYGADDNASGVAALLALAAYFSEHRPNHTLIFAAFDAEEMGLRGARAFVHAPPIPLEHIVLNVNLDMVSRSDRNELYACGTYHYPFLIPFVSYENPAVMLKTGHDRPGSGSDDWTMQSDHAVFHQAGIPFIYFGVEDHADYHTPNDTYERIQPDFFYNAVLAVLEVLKKVDREAVISNR
ncbi:M20/M25/M40 family metallo-hydrolase [Parapedobacter deserti]|uniref:M20/M25/M40 family metallo-hydrolase n=1 Tax=Parapedobacter deserti TaxID=1912957 RepID=A0ABV7JLK5_9SPHI